MGYTSMMTMDRAGLCAACAHAKVLKTKSGADIYLCEAAASDPRLSKFPPLPVRACPAHAPAA